MVKKGCKFLIFAKYGQNWVEYVKNFIKSFCSPVFSDPSLILLCCICSDLQSEIWSLAKSFVKAFIF